MNICNKMHITKVCCGYDSHEFCDPEDTKPLVLGGCVIDGHIGLKGVSDSDVVIHAIVDAILACTIRKSIGDVYREDDPRNQNKASKHFLHDCRNLLCDHDISIVNIDCVVVCNTPRISQYADKMCCKIAQLLDISKDQIFIKGKSTEGISGINGIICHTIIGFNYKKLYNL